MSASSVPYILLGPGIEQWANMSIEHKLYDQILERESVDENSLKFIP